MKFKTVSTYAIAAGMGLAGFAGIALADIKKPGVYPKRPITIIVCYGKGGGSDQAVAAMQGPLSKIMGGKVNKINKPGGGGVNCLPDFQQAPPDGYTILQHGDGMASKYVSGDMNLHPTRDLTPIAITNVAPTAMFVNPKDERFVSDGVASWDKVVAYAKANPGKLNVSNINVAMELATMGKLKVFADTKATGADYGLKWNPLLRIRSFWVKSDTPQEIKDYLDAGFAKAYQGDDHQAFLKRKALDIVNSYYGSKDMTKIFDEAVATYAKVFKATGQRIRKDMK